MATNHERDHRRYVTTASYWARDLPGVRHQDVDLIQFCAECWQPEWVMESKSSWVPPEQWVNTRVMARLFGAWSLLNVEPFRKNFQCHKSTGCPCDCHGNNSGLREVEIRGRDADGHPIDKQHLRHDAFVEFIRNIHEDHVRRGHDPDWWKRVNQVPRQQGQNRFDNS